MSGPAEHVTTGERRCSALRARCSERPRSVAQLAAAMLLAALLGACSTLPEADVVAELSVADVRSGRTSSQPVRWGGTIAQVNNTEQGTVLEVVSRPLRGSGRPRHNDQSDGRFLARINDFLDPEIIKPGRDVTFVGRVVGTEEGEVGEASYTFPVLDVTDLHYWRPEPERVVYPPGYYPWPPGYPYPGWYHDYWYDHPLHRPRPARRPAVDGDVDF